MAWFTTTQVLSSKLIEGAFSRSLYFPPPFKPKKNDNQSIHTMMKYLWWILDLNMPWRMMKEEERDRERMWNILHPQCIQITIIINFQSYPSTIYEGNSKKTSSMGFTHRHWANQMNVPIYRSVFNRRLVWLIGGVVVDWLAKNRWIRNGRRG